jgi:hypothetical protein
MRPVIAGRLPDTSYPIVGVTHNEEACGWPYFAGLAALRKFAGKNLPFVNGNEAPSDQGEPAVRR